ncbi:copper resistance protein NlpE N-terminal domain-containing protein [Prevotella falsenii]|uniref:copper resistance protein NlpE N-terminal domain-containing protein n=1 Tax=Prevotella falsenii TaxID=515414 RepID=UPI0004689565|nr:copper resistance protein NlpE N-terminal domain-containing protein [Prevotella falsenii]
MKKVFVLMAVCATMVACQQKGKADAEAKTGDTAQVETADTVRYTGEVPAADGPGIRYEIALAADSTNGFYMKETYIEAENGKDAVNNYTGTAEKIEKDVNGTKKVAYKFATGKDGAIYFLQVNDSTLRMVNDQLEESGSKELNYDLKLVK